MSINALPTFVSANAVTPKRFVLGSLLLPCGWGRVASHWAVWQVGGQAGSEPEGCEGRALGLFVSSPGEGWWGGQRAFCRQTELGAAWVPPAGPGSHLLLPSRIHLQAPRERLLVREPGFKKYHVQPALLGLSLVQWGTNSALRSAFLKDTYCIPSYPFV